MGCLPWRWAREGQVELSCTHFFPPAITATITLQVPSLVSATNTPASSKKRFDFQTA